MGSKHSLALQGYSSDEASARVAKDAPRLKRVLSALNTLERELTALDGALPNAKHKVTAGEFHQHDCAHLDTISQIDVRCCVAITNFRVSTEQMTFLDLTGGTLTEDGTLAAQQSNVSKFFVMCCSIWWSHKASISKFLAVNLKLQERLKKKVAKQSTAIAKGRVKCSTTDDSDQHRQQQQQQNETSTEAVEHLLFVFTSTQPAIDASISTILAEFAPALVTIVSEMLTTSDVNMKLFEQQSSYALSFASFRVLEFLPQSSENDKLRLDVAERIQKWLLWHMPSLINNAEQFPDGIDLYTQVQSVEARQIMNACLHSTIQLTTCFGLKLLLGLSDSHRSAAGRRAQLDVLGMRLGFLRLILVDTCKHRLVSEDGARNFIGHVGVHDTLLVIAATPALELAAAEKELRGTFGGVPLSTLCYLLSTVITLDAPRHSAVEFWMPSTLPAHNRAIAKLMAAIPFCKWHEIATSGCKKIKPSPFLNNVLGYVRSIEKQPLLNWRTESEKKTKQWVVRRCANHARMLEVYLHSHRLSGIEGLCADVVDVIIGFLFGWGRIRSPKNFFRDLKSARRVKR